MSHIERYISAGNENVNRLLDRYIRSLKQSNNLIVNSTSRSGHDQGDKESFPITPIPPSRPKGSFSSSSGNSNTCSRRNFVPEKGREKIENDRIMLIKVRCSDNLRITAINIGRNTKLSMLRNFLYDIINSFDSNMNYNPRTTSYVSNDIQLYSDGECLNEIKRTLMEYNIQNGDELKMILPKIFERNLEMKNIIADFSKWRNSKKISYLKTKEVFESISYDFNTCVLNLYIYIL
jgi:hypothetical protein